MPPTVRLVLNLLQSIAVAVATVWMTASPSWAQSKSSESSKYWIIFQDKDAGLGKGPAPIEPGFVTRRALERRALRGRPAPESLDAPVSPAYIDALRESGVTPLVESRWINGVSAYLSQNERLQIERLSFVREIRPVASSVPQSRDAEPVVVARHTMSNLDFGQSVTQLSAINAVDPLNEGVNGTGILLGFLDTTTDTTHPALQHLSQSGRIVAVRDIPAEFGLGQTNKHGLNTSSVALGFDEGDLIGACHGGSYIFATTEYAPTETNQEEDFFVTGMEWMERMGADIVNISLGYSTFDQGQRSYTYEDMDGNTAVTTRAADKAAGLGVVVVTSAGNEGCTSPQNCWYYVTSPADGDSVITAGASDFGFNPVNFSGSGPTFDGRTKPDVSAPGLGVYYATSSGGYSGNGGGTSFSSPFIASVACQILQVNPTLNPMDVRSVLRSTAHKAANPDNKLGWGVINAKAAVEAARITGTSSDRDEIPSGSVAVQLYPNPSNGHAVLTMDIADARHDVQIAVMDVLGREVLRANPVTSGSTVTANLDVRDLPSGTYYVRVKADRLEETRTLVVTH